MPGDSGTRYQDKMEAEYMLTKSGLVKSYRQAYPGATDAEIQNMVESTLLGRSLKIQETNPEMSVRDAEQQAINAVQAETVAALRKLKVPEEGALR